MRDDDDDDGGGKISDPGAIYLYGRYGQPG